MPPSTRPGGAACRLVGAGPARGAIGGVDRVGLQHVAWDRLGLPAGFRLESVGPACGLRPVIDWACGAVRCVPIDRGRIGAYRQAPAGPVRGRLSEVFRAEEWYIGDRCTMHAYAHARCLYEERPTTGSAGVWRNLR